LDGGLSRWQELGLPLESTEVNRIPTHFDVCLQADRILSTAELEHNVGETHRQKLLDARDRRRFLGEWEPIDPVAGHVPGSICLPFTDFLQEDGTWLPLNERRALLEKVLGPDKDVEWSVMCGSGVTACHLAISGLEAGYKEPRLYVGSWSEWIRGPNRPIGTGAGVETGQQTADLK
jgi:thiosulfate/3-mercaptopyruvate sulfurtransferase